jgi:IS605 OrfB family transposase
MNLVESHIIKPSHKDYKELDHLLFLSKNLYNIGLYEVRQHFFKAKEDSSIKYKYLNYYALNALLKGREDENYRALPANTSQEVLKLINQNFCSFFKTLSMKRERLMTNKVSIPKYLDSIKGRQVLIYNQMTIGKVLLKKGIIQLPKTKIQIKTKHPESLRQVRIVPKNSYIVIEVVYEIQEKELLKNNNKFLSIDLGIYNLATCSSNVIEPFIIDGKPVKSINQFYNKHKAELQSSLRGNKRTSKRIQHLTNKRNFKILNYLHKASKFIVNQAVSNSLNTIVIGYNKGWKQETNLGKKNNQNFVQIPFEKLISLISYKARLQGINVFLQEESYTSQVSFLEGDYIPTFSKDDFKKNPSGKRIKRGLYSSPKGLLNADVNGSLNILRKFLSSNNEDFNSPVGKSHVDWPVRIKNPQRIKL